MVFCNLSSKNKGKPMVFQHVQQNIAKSTGFMWFSRYLYGKNAKKHQFFNVFCNLSLKNKGQPMVFQYFQKYIAKNTCFIVFFPI